MLIHINVIPQNSNVDPLGCNFEVSGNLLTLEFFNHLSPLLLQVGCVLELESFINDVILGIEQELKHFQLVFEKLVT